MIKDTLELKPIIHDHDAAVLLMSKKGIAVYVNGQDLKNLVSKHSEDDVDYIELPASEMLAPSKNLYGLEDIGLSSKEHQAVLYACGGCGEVGCWPLLATVKTTDETVTWSSFSNPYRPEWTYDLHFVFDRKQYDTQVNQKITD